MNEEVKEQACDKCGEQVALAELTLDDESGLLLCPHCYLEQENCGCSDQ